MPFMTPASRMSMALRAPSVNFPASPLQSESESVTPRSQPYPSTPPVLDADIFDTVPFSASFSAFLGLSTHDGILQSPAITADTTLAPVQHAKRLSSQAEASYYVEQLTNIRDIDSEWEDDEVEEVMVISPKPKTSSGPLGPSLASILPTPPFSPPVERPEHETPKESYTILRTLHRTQTSHLSLAVSSGCTPSTKKSALRHALYAIRTYRMPLSHTALAERAALEVLSARGRGENPYVQRASRFWDDGQTLFIVLEHCGGGNLMGLIQAEGPVNCARMKRWASEIASGISFIHGAGIIHSNIRPTTILFRVNGHICISGFEHAIVIATRPNVPPSIEERQRGTLPSAREWCEAPEMLFGWEIGLEVDCWAFGVILVWMSTGKHPWYYTTRECPSMIRDCILNGILPITQLERVDTAIEHLITKCLDHNPCKRPTIEQIKAFEWFTDIDWENICLARVPDIQITLPTPDMTPDLPGDMPSTIIAPDLSLSTIDTDMEIEKSLSWTPLRISRQVGLVSPGATTIASGQSAVLSHGNGAPLFLGRPSNPSPPSLPSSSTGGGDTFTPLLQQRKKDEPFHESFLPELELSEGDGIMQVGLGVCVDEFGTFFSEQEPYQVAKHPDSYSGGSPEISLRDALALPIPLLITPRPSEIELRTVHSPGTPTPTSSCPPARLFRWGNNSNRSSPSLGVTRDVAAIDSFYERERGLPELSWHGLDADPFRYSPALSVPTEVREAGDVAGVGEAVESSRRMDATFRWSSASVEAGISPHMPRDEHEHEPANAHAKPFAGLGALTRRIRDQGRALLRKSRSNVLFPRARLAAGSSSPLPNPPPPLGNIAMAVEGGGLGGSVRRIGLGIGYTLPGPGSTVVPAPQAHGILATSHRRDSQDGTVPAGCYAGLGGARRGKKGAGIVQQRRQREPLGKEQRDNLGTTEAATNADGHPACEPTSGASPCDSGCVLILGNPGFGGVAVAPPAATPNVH